MATSFQTTSTEPTVLPLPEALSPQRSSYMAALSLAEQIMSVTAVLPTDFRVVVHSWSPSAPELSFYFHRDPVSLREFAAAQGLVESETVRGDGSVYVEATREDARGVRVVAWTLSDPKSSAVAA